jgi:NAD(P)H-hydrate epimerase
MRSLTSSASALAADRAAETGFGYEPWLLMEEAGIRLQQRVDELYPQGPAVYLAGPGNNGGDVYVMARHAFLRGRRDVCVVAFVPPSSASCRMQADRARRTGVPIVEPSQTAQQRLASAAVWIDGLWGTGLASPLRREGGEVLASLETLRAEIDKPVVAIDVPSGLWEHRSPGEPVLQAVRTLAPGWIKDFCYFPSSRPLCGVLEAVPLAFPQPADPSAQLVDDSDLPSLLPRVLAADHKGKRGHVALVGGAEGMTGALVLAARSSAAAGAGLVTLGCDAELISLVAPQVPAFQVRSVPDVAGRAARLDAFVVGPGWGTDASRPGMFESLWQTGLPLAADADALTVWKGLNLPPRDIPVVLTPHPGELARLAEVGTHAGDSVAAAAGLAARHGVTVVLKGAVTWILGPGRRAVWDGANPALGTGGSGDCLAGVVGALLARGLTGFDAAVAAVALHGTAGRVLASEQGWFTADGLPEAIARTALACMAAGSGL